MTAETIERQAPGRHAAGRRRPVRRQAIHDSTDDLLAARYEARRAKPKRHSKLRSATIWSYSLTIGKMAITTGLSLALAAMLGPRAFGVIAMALVFTNFIEMLQQQGMMPAIIARKTLSNLHADTAFWLVLGTGVVCTGLGLLAAPWWAGLNGLPELAPVIQVLALSVPLSSSVVVHEAILRRHLDFRKLAVRSWSSVLAGGVAGIAAAVAGWGVWALVTQQVVTTVTTVVVLWRVSHWRPRLRFSSGAAKDLWRYSVRSSASSLGLFLGGRLDVILAGALFGPVLVGLYRMGQRLTSMVVDVTARSMQAVSLPGLSALQDDQDAFNERLLRMQRVTAALALPMLGIVAGVAPAVQSLLGGEWAGTTEAIRILAVSQALSALTLLLGPALQARGKPGTLAVVLWIWGGLGAAALLTAAALDDAALSQLAVLCWAIVAASAGAAVLLLAVASRTFGIRITTFFMIFLPAVGAGIAAAGVASAVTWQLATSPLVAALLGGLLGAMVSVVVLAALDPVVRTILTPLLQVTSLQRFAVHVSLGTVTKRSRAQETAQSRTRRD
ncbi:oligosaccharide flippase family protein [Jiangella sp. DSM 45060]|uniref:oligosaccharide flippase family protein n=1 Tax=Jiangella sp. DSM 45060 TaxID=1798224 RepID=UPI00087B2DEA|nr:oligosaccharide flippase family protein [Jiangella sp. DSM 45060]SDT58809.1 Membrane protein involved in the export of O-antigen and teichoic acid [Jiangella sp. DSM 45060]